MNKKKRCSNCYYNSDNSNICMTCRIYFYFVSKKVGKRIAKRVKNAIKNLKSELTYEYIKNEKIEI